MDVLGLQGKVAVVTGGGGNIGAATVRMLGQVGARVVAVDSDGGAAEQRLGLPVTRVPTPSPSIVMSVMSTTSNAWSLPHSIAGTASMSA
jgi:NAD(P)-dependent dehydrogenase (short-subunit alcohol dehydrogenase family)